MKINGGCHCGRVTYEAEVEMGRVVICHCDDCQTLTGSAFRVSIPARREQIQVTGETRVYIKLGESGARRHQHFCPDCASHLFVHGEGDTADAWAIRWGGVRQRDQFAPTLQLWRRSAAPWVCAFDDVPAREKD
ncbi:GFA family protein [Phenylobacterium immobile]|uniref:GFA family protein n=1 Tax=Phenylobacterium immobile TaxID=21 RepID=UPI000ABA566D|nr:GFA family protein [Phenylobacterium immobile]